MKKASGMISPPGAGKSFRSPRSRDDGGGGYRLFCGILIGSLGFRHQGLLIGEGGGRGGGQCPHTLPRRGQGPPAPRGCGRPGTLLRLPSGLLVPHGK